MGDGLRALGRFVDAELGEQPGTQLGERGVAAQPRTVEVDGQVERQTALGQDEHPVGEQDRLVDVVGDEQHGRVVALAELDDRGRASGSG